MHGFFPLHFESTSNSYHLMTQRENIILQKHREKKKMLVTSINFSKKNLIIDLATFIKSHANVMNLEKSKYMDISIWREQLHIYFFITLYSINTHKYSFWRIHNRFRKKKKNVGKEEIARHEQFLLFPHFFLHNQKIVSPFVHIFDIISLFASDLEESKIGMPGKGLRVWETLYQGVQLLVTSRCSFFQDIF